MNEEAEKEPDSSRDVSSEAEPSPRLFFVGMALLLTAIVFVGFWPTYFRSIFLGQQPAEFGRMEITWQIHLHAAVFLTWMILLIVQTGLVARGRTRTHMQLGQYVAIFGLFVVLVGVYITFVSMQIGVSEGGYPWAQAPFRAVGSWTSLSLFAVLLGLGYAYRRRPEAHKRYMLLATIGLVRAANSRIRSEWMDEWGQIIFAVTVGPVWILLWLYDLYAEGRVHRATLIGTVIILLGELLFFATPDIARALFPSL